MRRHIAPGALVTFFLAAAAIAAPTEKWVEVRSPNFIVVCNAGEGQARKIALPGSILLFVDVPRQNVDRARVQRIRRGRRVWFGDALPRVTG